MMSYQDNDQSAELEELRAYIAELEDRIEELEASHVPDHTVHMMGSEEEDAFEAERELEAYVN